MKIGIIGAGFVGGNLGKGWSAKGHQIMFSSRDPHSDKMKALLAETGPNSSAGTIEQTTQFGEVLAVAMSWDALPSVLQSAEGWTGKIVIDVTNRFGPPPAGSVGSAAEDMAHFTGARVVKAFNTIGAEHYLNPVFGGQTAAMFLAGDDPEARQVVSGLAADLGFDPVDVGPLANAVLLENLARMWVTMARSGHGREFAFKLIRR